MNQSASVESTSSVTTYGAALAGLWPAAIGGVIPTDIGLGGAELPNLGSLLSDVGLVIDDGTSQSEDGLELLFVPDSFSEQQKRYFVGTRVAALKANAAESACSHDNASADPNCPQALACAAKNNIPIGHRDAVLGAMMLIPEESLIMVKSKFGPDVGMVASTFEVPLIAAHLRLLYDKQVKR